MNDEIKKYAISNEFYDKLLEIGKNQNLHIDQVGQLYSSVQQLLFGKLKKEDLVRDVAENVEIDTEYATKIVTEVNDKILVPLKEKMVNEAQKQTLVLEEKEMTTKLLEPVTKTQETFTVDPYREPTN